MSNDEALSAVDVVTTATIRPELINLTYLSFHDRVFRHFRKKRLIINIDPTGDPRYTADDVLSVCHKYFDEVVYRCPETPSFSSAFKWCWEQCQNKYVLHLEDDWFIKKKVDVSSIIHEFESNDDLGGIRFTKKMVKTRLSGFSPTPGFLRKKFIDEALPYFSLEYDPEEQFHSPVNNLREVLRHWKFWMYGEAGEPGYVIDTGTKWRRHHRLGKWNVDKSKPAGDMTATVWNHNHNFDFWRGLWFDFQYYRFMSYLRVRHALSMSLSL